MLYTLPTDGIQLAATVVVVAVGANAAELDDRFFFVTAVVAVVGSAVTVVVAVVGAGRRKPVCPRPLPWARKGLSAKQTNWMPPNWPWGPAGRSSLRVIAHSGKD